MEPPKPDNTGKKLLGCLLGGVLFVLVLLLIGYGVCSYQLSHMSTQ